MLFLSAPNAILPANKINSFHKTYKIISVRTSQRWFEKFKWENVRAGDEPWSNCHVDFDTSLAETEPHLTVDEMENMLNYFL